VGFEVESSWRSRKHIKGDLVNLLELQPALGVIVLLGEGAEVESTRQFARDMVNRRASRIEVWDESRVSSLESGELAAVTELLVDAGTDLAAAVEDPRVVHRSKYRKLSAWLVAQDEQSIRASFREIEEIIGLPLPSSSRNHVSHWHGYRGSAVARAVIDAGWRARDVSLTAETLRFERVTPAAAHQESSGLRS
jgi:hypothetical protein